MKCGLSLSGKKPPVCINVPPDWL